MTISERNAKTNGLPDIQSRVAEINKRVAPIIEENVRLTDAVNKAITLVLAMAAVGVFTVIAIAPTEQSLKARAIINQEQMTWK